MIFILVLALSACGMKKAEQDYYYEPKESDYYSGSDYSTGVNSSVTQMYDSKTEYKENDIKKIIVNSNISLETYSIDETMDLINKNILKYGGYVQSSRQYSRGSTKYITMKVRIPSNEYDAFMEESRKSGNVIDYSTNTQDITDSYYNIQAELESLRLEEERVKEFYKKANTIEELLTVERRLSEIQTQISQDEVTIKNYDLLTAYCTIDFNIEEVKVYTEEEKSFLKELVEEVKESFTDFTSFLENLLFGFIHMFWYIALLLLIIFILKKLNVFSRINFKPVRLRKRKEEKNREEL